MRALIVGGQQVVSGSRYRRVIQATIQCRPIQHPVLNEHVALSRDRLQLVASRTPFAAAASTAAMALESRQ